MKSKNLFLKSTFILLIGSLITRTLGFFIRIVFTRIIGTEGINLYSLVMPTYSLLISLTQLGLPIAISTLVSRENKRSKKIVISALPIIIVINIIMILSILFSANFIANNLLMDKNAFYPIIAMATVLPFISISSILRGYFFGKQKMTPPVVSNVIEQISRFIIIIIFLPKLVKINITIAVCGYILLGVISEIISIIIFLIYLPKNTTITKGDLKPDLITSKEILNLCLPTVGGRIIGNVAYFFEPIILLKALLSTGYSKSFIINEYGIYNSYVIPLLIIPSFIVQAISTSLIPEISKSYALRNKKNIKKRIYQSLLITLLLGIITNTFVFFFAKDLLEIIYNTNEGITYIKVLSFFFILYNLEGPLSSTLQAIGKTNLAFRSATIAIIVKSILIFLLSFLHIGLYGLVIAEICNILIITFLNFKYIKKEFIF